MKSGGYLRESILADVVEAIIAAIYLDGGLSSAEAFIKNIFKTVACQTVLLKTAPVATASNRRQAEQLAAEQVLAQLEEKPS